MCIFYYVVVRHSKGRIHQRQYVYFFLYIHALSSDEAQMMLNLHNLDRMSSCCVWVIIIIEYIKLEPATIVHATRNSLKWCELNEWETFQMTFNQCFFQWHYYGWMHLRWQWFLWDWHKYGCGVCLCVSGWKEALC